MTTPDRILAIASQIKMFNSEFHELFQKEIVRQHFYLWKHNEGAHIVRAVKNSDDGYGLTVDDQLVFSFICNAALGDRTSLVLQEKIKESDFRLFHQLRGIYQSLKVERKVKDDLLCRLSLHHLSSNLYHTKMGKWAINVEKCLRVHQRAVRVQLPGIIEKWIEKSEDFLELFSCEGYASIKRALESGVKPEDIFTEKALDNFILYGKFHGRRHITPLAEIRNLIIGVGLDAAHSLKTIVKSLYGFEYRDWELIPTF